MTEYFPGTTTCDICDKPFTQMYPNDPAYDAPMDICDECNGGECIEDRKND